MAKIIPISATKWTSLNIWLHWLIVILVAVQYLIGEGMVAMFDSNVRGANATDGLFTLGNGHILVGSTILVATLIRLWDRYTKGRPTHPHEEPNWAASLAKVTHFLLYAFLIAMPIAGLLAWWQLNEGLADYHKLASSVLLGVIAFHVAGALVNHYWFKTDVLRRILPSNGR